MGFWLYDDQLRQLSRRHPSTAWGVELMQAVWPQQFGELLCSETYRGYASVLVNIHGQLYRGIGLDGIERVIEGVDQSAKTLPVASAARGGAGLAVANAWQRAHCGITSDQFAAACESEVIYAAGLFVRACQHEMAGHILP